MNPRKLRSLRPFLLAVILATVVWASWRHVSGHISIEGMRALVDSDARYGPLAFMALVVAGLFTRVPMAGTLLIAMGAVLFGPFRAFAYGWVAALVGTTGTFLFVRYVARDYVHHVLDRFSPRLRALDDRLTRNGFWTVLGLRLVLGLAPLLNWGLGVTGVRARDYVAGTALGVVPNIVVAVSFADVIANRLPGSGTVPLTVALGAALVIAIAASATIARRLRRQPKPIESIPRAWFAMSPPKPDYGIDAPFVLPADRSGHRQRGARAGRVALG
jgi:uncharacterized membrane protein YdjX (TVP38/TMEM64 family)